MFSRGLRETLKKTIIGSLFVTLCLGLVFIENSEAQKKSHKFTNGQAALDKLGDQIGKVARAHGFKKRELKRLFKKDKSLHVDNTDKLLYIENTVAASDLANPAEEASVWYNIAPSEAFALNSKPGSQRTILLDFDGFNAQDTAWGNYDAPPFDLDGNPSTFSDTERNRIIGIWKRVAEDYAPFDVNVTTQDPGQDAITRSSSSDSVYGTRAVITKQSYEMYATKVGGVAYVGVFDYTSNHGYYQPAWVFYDNLGGGNERYTAEAISHEVGHNLGLSHDGTSTVGYYKGHGSGETGWAPIMGVGYYQTLVQWSKGEYADANNTQDDIVVIGQNGVSIRADDHGDSQSSATLLSAGTTFIQSGIIETRDDVDYFRFQTGAGEVLIDASVSPNGPNLDIHLSVISAATGQVVASANPENLLASGLSFAASEGTYFVAVDGVGKGDPATTGYSDYGSLGNYTLSGTLPAPSSNQAPDAIAGASTLNGVAPLSVNFDASASSDPDGTISSYSWDFGDGNTDAGINPQHSFAAGSWTVILTVVDDKGFADVDTLTINVTEAPNQAPTANASVNSSTGTAPLTVTFSSNGSFDPDGSISSYLWNFGDGTSSSSANPSHTFSNTGDYNVQLTVTDNDGATDFDQVTITVEPDPDFIAPPSALSASTSGSDVQLRWSDNSTNEQGFRVHRGILSGKGKNKSISWSLVATLGAGVTTHTDSGLSDGTYQYQIEAFHSSRSAFSPTLQVNLSSGGSGGGGSKGKGNRGKN